jgi:glutamate racemase
VSDASQAIGIFDSGMGGLTVMRALMARLPNESFIYLGDTARLPYGTKSGETVTRYAVQAASVLVRRHVKLIVVACNTASSVALPALGAALAPMPVIGVVEPGAQAAVNVAPNGPIAVLATESTVRGEAYVRAIHSLSSDAEIVQQACPLFVPLAEEGLVEGPIAELIAERYLAPLFAPGRMRPRCVVLGCTHFPVLQSVIAKAVGNDVPLVDSATTTAQAVMRLLAERDIAREARSPARVIDIPRHGFSGTFRARGTNIPEAARFAPDNVELVDLQDAG